MSEYRTDLQIIESQEDIFKVPVQAIVNPVNLKGVMGKGLASAFKCRYPEAYTLYRRQCLNGVFQFGQVLLYHIPDTRKRRSSNLKMIVHFPTKIHWRDTSDYGIIEESLSALLKCVQTQKIESLAIPPIGCGLGGLNSMAVKSMIYESFLDATLKHLKIIYLLRFPE